MSTRKKFGLLNRFFDVKHIALDLKKDVISDEEVFKEAIKTQQLIVTFNGDDFKPFVAKSSGTGIIAVSDNLATSKIDSKLVALLVRSSPKTLFGSFTSLTGET